MSLDQNATYLLVGGIVGFVSFAIGALLDYRNSQRRNDAQEGRLPGCTLLTSMGLGIIGAIVSILSYILIQSIRPAVLTGVGVVTGFTGALIILTLGWLFWPRRHSEQEKAAVEEGIQTNRYNPKSPTSK
ncbi:MAG: hypothetical protein GY803_29450 [Chloroflexi bacterium]|nr:hypothetical protein [Chloroflexota bacterium]